MQGTLKADKHFVTFSFDWSIVEDFDQITPARFEPSLGYVWVMGFIGGTSYMIDIMPMDEARYMYE